MKVINIILGVLLSILGIWCMFTPFTTFLAFFELAGWFIGLGLTIMGISGIVSYFSKHKEGNVTGWDLTAGILTLIFGILVLSNSFIQLSLDIFMFWFCIIWLIAIGILKIANSISLKQIGSSVWGFVLTVGILAVLLGIFAIFNVGAFAIAEGWIISFFILMSGFNLISLGCAME